MKLKPSSKASKHCCSRAVQRGWVGRRGMLWLEMRLYHQAHQKRCSDESNLLQKNSLSARDRESLEKSKQAAAAAAQAKQAQEARASRAGNNHAGNTNRKQS